MTAHVKEWLMLSQKCFDDSEFLVGLLCPFHLTSALRLVPPMQREQQEQTRFTIIFIF